ncbi:Elongator complex protein 6 [Platanthera zijinensis]|uniref:Elongator complex protein 6 n=1 Tax=Platanthera zijinensis TaxID=2320716 RepID=A0AAP0B0L4_9ASPA
MNTSPHLLDEALGLMPGISNGGALSQGCIVLIEDSVETSGAFILHYIVKRALSLDSSGIVLFLALAHPFSHYERILRKLANNLSRLCELFPKMAELRQGARPVTEYFAEWKGCNLSVHREQKRFHLFDILQLEFPCESKKDSVEQGLVELYSKIQSAVEVISSRDHSRAHISILIDDLSILEIAAHGSMDHVLNFLHYCVTLTSEQNCSLVILNHEDIYPDIEGRRLLSHLVYLADFIIKAEPLATGIAADVHGQLTVLKKGTSNNGHYSADKASNFHFQVKEHGVDLFFPGSRC